MQKSFFCWNLNPGWSGHRIWGRVDYTTPGPVLAPAMASMGRGLQIKTDHGMMAWETRPTWAGSDEIRLGFRCVSTVKRDHYLNRIAAAVTTTPTDLYRGGRYGNMCHVELMLRPNKDVWLRHSIYMKQYDPETQTLVPATVHSKVCDTYAWDSKYEFVTMHVPREAQTRGMQFLSTQVGVPFNFNAYYWNTIGGDFGTHHFEPEMLHTPAQSWYCTEVISAALQAIASHPSVEANAARRSKAMDPRVAAPGWNTAVQGIVCNHSNPNSLYRALRPLNAVLPALPPDPNFLVELD